MPFVRFSRDKRGYEHVYLVHANSNRGQSSAARILYWYRTPPGVKVGREPFDESVRRSLEAEYPNLVFDWKRIVSTQMPPPETENWRERRKNERAMKQARAAEESESGEEAEGPGEEPASALRATVGKPASALPPSSEAGAASSSTHVASETPGDSAGAPGSDPRRRRRRGGRRRRKPGASSDAPGSVPASPAVDLSAVASAEVDSEPADLAQGDTLEPHEEE